MPGLANAATEVCLMEPRSFDEMPRAIQALRERTGQSFGYRYYDSADARRPATRRWRDWADDQDPAPGNPGTPPPNNTASATPAN